MEMSQVTPRTAQMPPIRGPHGGWQQQEIDALKNGVETASQAGESLRSVFERMGQALGRKPNSIRNFYYAQLRAQESDGQQRSLPFEVFAPDEVEALIESVITARAKGMSVRACVRALAGGDHTKMLRLQNKYRSTVRTREDLVRRVMASLDERGIPYVSPYVETRDGRTSPQPIAAEKRPVSNDERIASLYASIDDLVARVRQADAQPQLPSESEAQKKADRLQARYDLLRIELDDEKNRLAGLSTQAQNMASLLRDYIALPEGDRISHCMTFCRDAAAQLSAMEAAMTGQDIIS